AVGQAGGRVPRAVAGRLLLGDEPREHAPRHTVGAGAPRPGAAGVGGAAGGARRPGARAPRPSSPSASARPPARRGRRRARPRATSMLIGTVLGATVLGEGDTRRRVLVACAILLGVAALAVG